MENASSSGKLGDQPTSIWYVARILNKMYFCFKSFRSDEHETDEFEISR
jgi:hypothetical protein